MKVSIRISGPLKASEPAKLVRSKGGRYLDLLFLASVSLGIKVGGRGGSAHEKMQNQSASLDSSCELRMGKHFPKPVCLFSGNCVSRLALSETPFDLTVQAVLYLS